MNKSDIDKHIALDLGLDYKHVDRITDAFLHAIIAGVFADGGDGVDLRRFGTFELRKLKERVGRNPKTGEALLIPAKMYPKFRAFKQFSDTLNQPGTPDPEVTAI